MSIQNLTQPNDYNIFGENITCTNIDLITINGEVYEPSPAGPVPVLVPNKFLRTNGTPNMFWGDVTITPAQLIHGTANQILHTNNTGTASEWTSSLIVPGAMTSIGNGVFQQDLAVQNELNVTNDLTIIDGNMNITSGKLEFGGVLGLNNQIPVSDGSGVAAWQTPDPSILAPGNLNQVLISGVLPGPVLGATWSNDLDLPGVLNVTDATTLQSTLIVGGAVSNQSTTQCIGVLSTVNGSNLSGTTNIVNNLQMNSNSGSIGDYLTKTGPTTQNWAAPPNIKNMRFVAYFAAQDLNVAASNVVNFNNVNIISNIASGSVSAITGISMASATQFTIGFTGTYDIDITGFITPASAGIGNSIIAITAEVGGFEISRNAITNNAGNGFTGKIPSVVITAGQVLRVLSTRIIGANQLNTSAVGSLSPNYPSTIAISLVNTV